MPSLRTLGPGLLVASLALCACDEVAETDDDPWMRPTDLGKADVALLPSAEIPSAFVVAGAEYFFERDIATLEDVGALQGVHAALARRADGIIPALPANDRLDIEELVRLETPAFFATLFPEEQAALPELWPLLLAPSGPSVTPLYPAFEPLVSTDVSTDPGVLSTPAPADIATLRNSVRNAASRVQLIADDDGSPDTISVGDIDVVLADPFAFTPQEVDALEELREALLATATSSADARVEVPVIRDGPFVSGAFSHSAEFGGITLSMRTLTDLQETHGYTRRAFEHMRRGFDVTIELSRDRRLNVNYNPNHQVVVLDEVTGDEFVLPRGALSRGLPASRYTFERYDDGVRVASERVELPDLSAGMEVVDLSEYAGFDFVQTNGVPLFREDAGTSVQGNDPAHITDFVTFTESGPGTLEYPDPRIPPGLYELQSSLGPVVVEVFPAGAMRFTDWVGDTVWMNWTQSISSGLWRIGQTDAIRAVYVPSQQELRLFTRANNPDWRQVLHGADRTG